MQSVYSEGARQLALSEGRADAQLGCECLLLQRPCTRHPGWQPQFLFLLVAVPFAFPEQIVAQPRHIPASRGVLNLIPSKASSRRRGYSAHPGTVTAPLCPSESPHCRLLPKEGSASAPLPQAAACRQELWPGRSEGNPSTGLWEAGLLLCTFTPVPVTTDPLAGPA